MTVTPTASCHSDTGGRAAPAGSPVLALVGAPNSGKSTLFNALTGGHRTVGNWPGTTVEVGRAAWDLPVGACGCATTCTPGCTCGCPGDAPLTAELLDLPGAYSLTPASPDEALTRELLVSADPPDLTVVVVNALAPARGLHLVAELREEGRRLLVALTMMDVAARRGLSVDPAALATGIGAPVVALDPRRRSGGDLLGEAARAALSAAPLAARSFGELPEDPDELDLADERFAWVEAACADAVTLSSSARPPLGERVDRWLTAPVVGPLFFLGVMWLVFQATTTVAVPLQDLLDRLISGPVSSLAHGALSLVGLGDTWVNGFVVDGLIAGVGTVLTFAPLMAIMFACLALLEDSGYLARAAVVTDRTMRRLGLPGKAFLPLVVGFGCNVPAISATRILGDARQRILVTLLVPFTSCSARLTVYVMLAATFFPAHAGTVVFGLYVLSIALVIGVGLVMRRTLWRTMGSEPLVLDLPAYQRPTLRLTLSLTWLRLQGFLRTAGGIIVVTVTVVWLLQALPTGTGLGGFGQIDPSDSVFAAVSGFIAPIFAPLGFADWHTVGALVVGFVAKEGVLSSWAQTYAAADPTAGGSSAGLSHDLVNAFAVSSGGHTTAAVLAFLVFLLAYTPCVATVAAQYREVGLRWTAFGMAVQLGVAWLLGLLVFTVGSVIA
ncbi:ferrous iron transport protein B [Nocardioides sp. GY 10127]|nr:ferrous iron transport protein B [Nocardioides sp. GY 10127]